MKKSTKTTITHGAAATVGGVVVGVVMIAALDRAFRIPQDVKAMQARLDNIKKTRKENDL